MPSPELLPAIIGAVLGFAAMLWTGWHLSSRWSGYPGRKKWIVGVAFGLFQIFYWINVYAWLIEPNTLVVRRVTIVSEQWQGAPLTIAAIADTHVGSPHVNAARMGSIVRRVNRLHPDLVVLLGDYAGGHQREEQRSGAEQQEITGGIATFAALTPRYGVVGVLGNHDSWYNRTSITQAMEQAGIAVLRNRNVTIGREGGDFVVAGIADADTDQPDFTAALDGAEGQDTIVLSHSPDPFAQMPRGPALMLAGHGHCGQVTIPFVGRPILPLRNRNYGCHMVSEGGKQMYVSAGIGTSIVPVRFLNPPEIVLVTLRSAAPEPPMQG
ncbi:metallophosphoesterase [Terricaulis sp.]|uniref:metallophosphoesterase n=1 Tax=Terricaulis sp. TaxID=2768686 RepID=UPI0037831329